MKMKATALLVFAFFLLPLLSACLGATQVEEYGYVQSFGIGKGENKRYAYSFLLQYYAAAGEGSEQEGNHGVIIGAEGDTIFEAIALSTAGLPYELNFSRTASVFIAEELAKENGMDQIFSISFSALKMRDSVEILIVNGDPRVFQEGLQVKNSPDLLQMQRSVLYSNQMEGTVPNMNYAMFYEAVKTGRFDPTVQYGGIDEGMLENGAENGGKSAEGQAQQSEGKQGDKEKQESEKEQGVIEGVKRYGGMASYADGTALFDGMKMVGTLNAEETKYMLLSRGDLGKAYIDYVCKDGRFICIQIAQESQPQIELELGETPHALFYIPLVCEIYFDTMEESANIWDNGVKQEMESYMQDAARGVFLTCRDLGCDALALGKKASMQLATIEAWENYDWKENYKTVEATFRITLTLRDSNTKSEAE